MALSVAAFSAAALSTALSSIVHSITFEAGGEAGLGASEAAGFGAGGLGASAGFGESTGLGAGGFWASAGLEAAATGLGASTGASLAKASYGEQKRIPAVAVEIIRPRLVFYITCFAQSLN